ncbi:MAG: hypothetical protein GY870_16005 [archaeon]|nr:hypothetical protein [archaeon]
MVKHPKYQAMDSARELMIQKSFEIICNEQSDLKLISHEPLPSKEVRTGPIPRPTFEVLEGKSGDKIAEFFPNGYSKCLKANFQPLFEKMVSMIEESAQKAYLDFEKFENNRFH